MFWWGRNGMRSGGQQTPECIDGAAGLRISSLAAVKGANFAVSGEQQLCVFK